MSQSKHTPASPREPAWDTTFTRLTRAVLPQIQACALEMAHRFQAIGVGSDTQVQQTPRGLSTFLALFGQRGLICILDLTLVDGMAVNQGPRATLDMRLLDACGDVVQENFCAGMQGRTFDDFLATKAPFSEFLGRAATGIYVAALAQFDLIRPQT